MLNFQFYFPSKVVFGRGEFAHLGQETAAFGRKAMLVKQEGPLEEMGVYRRAQESLEAAGVKVTPFGYIPSNPKLSIIKEGVKLAKREGVDVLVAVGGGSCIDAAKAIAIGALDDGELWDFWARKRMVERSLPVIACSTISATGAETSCHVVVTNDSSPDTSKWQKWGLHDNHAIPKTAIIDPELLTTVPAKLTAAGMADTISHVIEGYFDGVPDNPISDRICEGIVATVIENKRVLQHPDDVEARSAISWAATLAMSGLADCGRSNAGWPAHWIQHAVGALTDSSHGAGLAVINPAWLEHENRRNPAKFVQFAQRVFGIERTPGMTDEAYGQAGIDALKREFREWGLPTTVRELGVRPEMIPAIVESVMSSPETYVFDPEEVAQLLFELL